MFQIEVQNHFGKPFQQEATPEKVLDEGQACWQGETQTSRQGRPLPRTGGGQSGDRPPTRTDAEVGRRTHDFPQPGRLAAKLREVLRS